jgi:SAM-dependent methyltransferase
MSIHSDHKVAPDLDTLKASYDDLYSRGWMREQANIGEALAMLRLLDPQPGTSLLDVACGMGHLLRVTRPAVGRYGVDLSPVAIAGARQLVPGAAFTVGDGERLPWPDNSFDYITSLGSLEHYLHPALGMAEIARLLRPTGRAAILLPNSHDLKSIYNVGRYGEVISHLQEYERFATRREWETLLTANGLVVDQVAGYNFGLGRVFRPGREGFFIVYNTFFRLFGRWIPVNLSDVFIFICRKQTPTVTPTSGRGLLWGDAAEEMPPPSA